MNLPDLIPVVLLTSTAHTCWKMEQLLYAYDPTETGKQVGRNKFKTLFTDQSQFCLCSASSDEKTSLWQGKLHMSSIECFFLLPLVLPASPLYPFLFLPLTFSLQKQTSMDRRALPSKTHFNLSEIFGSQFSQS